MDDLDAISKSTKLKTLKVKNNGKDFFISSKLKKMKYHMFQDICLRDSNDERNRCHTS